jgi:hypothetical protein
MRKPLQPLKSVLIRLFLDQFITFTLRLFGRNSDVLMKLFFLALDHLTNSLSHLLNKVNV